MPGDGVQASVSWGTASNDRRRAVSIGSSGASRYPARRVSRSPHIAHGSDPGYLAATTWPRLQARDPTSALHRPPSSSSVQWVFQ